MAKVEPFKEKPGQMFSGTPVLESPKVACLDWSAAAKGPLVAYRWDGESQLSNEKLVAAG